MKQFKQIIEIEKKYYRTISSAKKRAQTKLENFEFELKNKEEEIKEIYKKGLEKESNNLIKNAKADRDLEIKGAKNKAEIIEKNAHYDDAVKFVLKKIRKFGDIDNV